MSIAFIRLIPFLLLSCLALSAPAQEPFFKGALVSVGPGFNRGGFFQGYGGYGDKMPGLAASFALDFRLDKTFSLGLIAGGSRAELEIDPAFHRQTGPNVNPSAERLLIKGNRTVVGLRALFHYKQEAETEIYSGFRFGLALSRRKTNTGLYEYDLPPTAILPGYHATIKTRTTQFSFQLILLGIRYFPLKTVGFGGEIGIGAPYYAGLWACFRLPKAAQ